MGHNPYRRTKGEQNSYLLPEQVKSKDIRCECGNIDYFLSDEYGTGSRPILSFCQECGAMNRMKIAEWKAYQERYE